MGPQTPAQVHQDRGWAGDRQGVPLLRMERGSWGGGVGLGQAAKRGASGFLWGLCRLLGISKAFRFTQWTGPTMALAGRGLCPSSLVAPESPSSFQPWEGSWPCLPRSKVLGQHPGQLLHDPAPPCLFRPVAAIAAGLGSLGDGETGVRDRGRGWAETGS